MRAMVPVLLLVLAGCVGQTPDPSPSQTGTAAPGGPVALVPVTAVTDTGCRELQGAFDAPRDGFGPLVPEGFTLEQGSAPGTARVTVFGWDCVNGTELWAGVLAQPPARLRNATAGVEAILLRVLVDNVTHAAVYGGWGTPAVLASMSTSDFLGAGAARSDRLSLGTTSLTYDLTLDVAARPGAVGEMHYRYWTTNGTTGKPLATGWIDHAHTPGAVIGVGTARFQQSGDPAAPPTTAGVGERIDGTTFIAAFHAVDAGI